MMQHSRTHFCHISQLKMSTAQTVSPKPVLLRVALTDRGTDGGDVVRLQVDNDILDSLDAFFCGEAHFVVFAVNEGSHLRKNK